MNKTPLQLKIKKTFGNQKKLAEILGVTQQAVSFWTINLSWPPLLAKKVEEISKNKIKRKEFNPTVFC